MDAKQELAGQLLILAYEQRKPDPRRIRELLSDCSVSRATGLGKLDFAQQIERFLDMKAAEGLVKKTVHDYRAYLTLFSEHVGKRAAEVTTSDIRGYISYLSTVRKNQSNSIQLKLTALRGFYDWLVAEEAVGANPLIRIKSSGSNRINTKRPLSPEQMGLLRSACRTSREKALLEFLYSSACFVSEAAQIELEDVDFERRSVAVTGKGGKRRIIYFSRRADVLIRQYLAARPGGTGLFCVSRRRPYARLSEHTIYDEIRALGERAGIARIVHPNILRHTLAADLLNREMDVKIIQKIMGHTKAESTEIYTGLADELVRREYDKYLL